MQFIKKLLRRLAGAVRRTVPPVLEGVTATLVIVDMQPEFTSSRNPKVLAAVERLISLALKKGWSIIFLEYERWGETNARLTDLLDPARLAEAVHKKSDDDGSYVVRYACRTGGHPTEWFIVCGVNIHACVADTVTGLSKLFPESRIDVIREACNGDSKKSWYGFPKRKNVFLTREKQLLTQ